MSKTPMQSQDTAPRWLEEDECQKLREQVDELLRAWLALPEWQREHWMAEIVKTSMQYRAGMEKQDDPKRSKVIPLVPKSRKRK